VHDDLVERDFTAPAPNRLWLSDITEHWTGEGKLYLCAVKDVYSNRIVGYSIDSRMKSSLAVAALNNAVERRRADGAVVVGCVMHTDRESVPVQEAGPPAEPSQHRRLDGAGRRGR
jgi:transposase InsO family protein